MDLGNWDKKGKGRVEEDDCGEGHYDREMRHG